MKGNHYTVKYGIQQITPTLDNHFKQQTNLINYFLCFYRNEVVDKFGCWHRVAEASTEVSEVHAVNPAHSQTLSTHKNGINMTPKSL
jgi:hypothetical protein